MRCMKCNPPICVVCSNEKIYLYYMKMTRHLHKYVFYYLALQKNNNVANTINSSKSKVLILVNSFVSMALL